MDVLESGTITTTATNQTVNLTGWKLNQLTLTAKDGGTYQLTVKATSTEQSNNSSAATQQTFNITILGGGRCGHPAGINSRVTYLNPGIEVEEPKPCVKVSNITPCSWLSESSTITIQSRPNGNNRDQERTEVWLK